MNILIAALTFLLGNAKSLFKESSSAFSQQMLLHVRALVIVIVTCVGALAVFCTSLCLLIASIAKQSEMQGELSFTFVQGIYVGASLVSLAVLLYSLRRKTWLGITEAERAEESKKSHGPIENAIALLVMDFIEARQNERHSQNSHASESEK